MRERIDDGVLTLISHFFDYRKSLALISNIHPVKHIYQVARNVYKNNEYLVQIIAYYNHFAADAWSSLLFTASYSFYKCGKTATVVINYITCHSLNNFATLMLLEFEKKLFVYDYFITIK